MGNAYKRKKLFRMQLAEEAKQKVVVEEIKKVPEPVKEVKQEKLPTGLVDLVEKVEEHNQEQEVLKEEIKEEEVKNTKKKKSLQDN